MKSIMSNGFEKSWKKEFLIALAVLIVLLCLAYLPKINHVGFLQDDWSTLYVTESRGAGELVFHFSLDRPLRGYFGLAEYRLMGTNMTAYQVTALLWRFLDTVALYLILMLIWPGKWKTNVLICVLALIYPGFHEQPHAFDYQAHLFSRMSLLFSFLFSLLPFYVRRNWLKVVFVLLAILLAQGSYALMEIYIGMEALRFALLVVVALQSRVSRNWWKTLGYNSIYMLNAGVFIVWRLFIFEEKRASVDAGAMLSGYDDFGVKLLENLGSLGVNLYRLIISAFYKPLVVFGRYLDEEDWFIGISIAILAVVFLIIVMCKLLRNDVNNQPHSQRNYPLVLIVVGLVGSIGALAPIIFGGREITYTISGDRFSYPGSISACLFIIGLIWLLKPRWLRIGLTGILVFAAVLTQFSNNVIFEKNGDQTRAVWWQMSWRAPQIQPATLLGGRVYLGMLSEDYTLWGPANLIYYPENHDITITAEVLDDQTLPLFLAGNKAIAERRGIPFERDFANLLIVSKTENACLHVIDGEHPEYSQGDDTVILEVGQLSQPGRIDVNSNDEPKPREDLFGREPEHDWCYFYQKGQLARQERDWQLTAQWGNEALEGGYSPYDKMEWLVFLQAFAYTDNGDYGDVLQEVLADNYTSGQACQVFSSYTEEIAQTKFIDEHEQLLKDVCGAGK